MSVKVKKVSKLYGTQKALDSISFEVNKGEITGFLGPNGAGKSTMMKIITCFIPPSSGEVFVCGNNINSESIEVRKKVGYLPENNPLYPDMYIKEYLKFVGEIYKISENKKRISEIIQLTGLANEQHKKIGALSKGYRQRVGLAQALIHDPEVLILDEPTSGLDPNQLKEIRDVIKEIGKEKTVMLSTHIMQEVQAICNKVIIINKGKIVADTSTQQLATKSDNTQIVKVEFDKPVQESFFKGLPQITAIDKLSDVNWKIKSTVQEDLRPYIFNLAVQNSLTVLTMHKEEGSLEDIFRKLTK